MVESALNRTSVHAQMDTGANLAANVSKLSTYNVFPVQDGELHDCRNIVKAKLYGQHFRSTCRATLFYCFHATLSAQLATQQISVLQVAAICCAK